MRLLEVVAAVQEGHQPHLAEEVEEAEERLHLEGVVEEVVEEELLRLERVVEVAVAEAQLREIHLEGAGEAAVRHRLEQAEQAAEVEVRRQTVGVVEEPVVLGLLAEEQEQDGRQPEEVGAEQGAQMEQKAVVAGAEEEQRVTVELPGPWVEAVVEEQLE